MSVARVSKIVYKFVRSFGVRLSKATINNELSDHPDYLSMLSISDVLASNGIQNISIQLEAENLGSLPVPFLVPMYNKSRKKTEFAFVNEVSSTHIKLTSESAAEHLTLEDFSKRWPTKMAMIADASKALSEDGFFIKQATASIQKLILFSAALSTIVVIGYVNWFIAKQNLHIYPVLIVFLVATLLGLFTTALLSTSVDVGEDTLLSKVCKSAEKNSCQDVVSSSYATVFGIRWSDIGLAYFSGIELLLLTSYAVKEAEFTSSMYSLFFLLSGVSLFYAAYSLYMQKFILKQWCTLCIVVQILLLVQFASLCAAAWTGPLLEISFMFNYQLIGSAVTFFLVSISLTSLITGYISTIESSKKRNRDLIKFKFSPKVFSTLLASQRRVTEVPNTIGISIGSMNAKHTIVKVCNPYCKPCAKSHLDLEHLLTTTDDIRVQIIFTASPEKDDKRAEPVRHFLALSRLEDRSIISKALDDWYAADKKDYQEFSTKYPTIINDEYENAQIAAMRDWCDSVKIEYTPTILINGHELPSMYNVKDLRYLLTDVQS